MFMNLVVSITSFGFFGLDVKLLVSRLDSLHMIDVRAYLILLCVPSFIQQEIAFE